MSFTNKEPLQPKLTAMPASKDVEALVRAEHHDPFSILGPHDDEQGGQFIRAFLPEALSVQLLSRDTGEPIGSLDATQVPGLFIGHFSSRQAYLLKIQWAGANRSPKTLTVSSNCCWGKWTCTCLPKAITVTSAAAWAPS